MNLVSFRVPAALASAMIVDIRRAVNNSGVLMVYRLLVCAMFAIAQTSDLSLAQFR
jgi:hypothetical protein